MRGNLLAFFAAACWGLAPIVAKLALRQVSPMIGMGVRSAIAAGLVLGWLFATGRYRVTPAVTSPTMIWLAVEALLATVVGDAAYFYALKHGKAGQVSLIMAASPLITLLAAVLLLDEPLTLVNLVGAMMMIVGLLMISL